MARKKKNNRNESPEPSSSSSTPRNNNNHTSTPHPSPQVLRIQRTALNLPDFNRSLQRNKGRQQERDTTPERRSESPTNINNNPNANSNDEDNNNNNNSNCNSKATSLMFNEQRDQKKRLIQRTTQKTIASLTSSKYWINILYSWIPITFWLPRYEWKQNLTADLLVGITVAIFQVPQSMGYCLIAHVPPVHGLYTAFFPPLIYAFLGTSRHSAVGAFALVSGVMTGHLVLTVSQEELDAGRGWNSTEEEDAFHVSIATSASLSIGLLMLLFGILRLGFVSIYLSPQSISGFCCAASVYVFTSQLRHLTGVDYPPRSGFLAVPYAYYDLVVQYKEIHIMTLVISVVCIFVLAFFKVYLNVKFMKWQKRVSSKWNPLPFPIELVVVIVMTILSNTLGLNTKSGIEVVGEIKEGMPSFNPPSWSMTARIFPRAVPLAAVGYAISLSIARLFGGKHSYSVDSNQELTALGACNLVGSVFGCLPSAASLPRSAIQEDAGGKTQVVSLVNCAALLVVILAVGSLLEQLPNCVLASIISVALIGLISQAKDLVKLWRISSLDGLQWLISFWAVILLDVDIGLYVGTGFALLVLIYRSSSPKTYLLGSSDFYAQDVYVPVKIYANTLEDDKVEGGNYSSININQAVLSAKNKQRKKSLLQTKVAEKRGIKVYQFCGPLHFSSKDFFKRDILKQCLPSSGNGSNYNKNIEFVVIDCSMISYVDSAGLDALKQVIRQELNKKGIKALLSSCAPHVVDLMTRDCSFFEDLDVLRPQDVFVSVHDAVIYAMEQQQVPNNNNISVNVIGNGTTDNINHHESHETPSSVVIN